MVNVASSILILNKYWKKCYNKIKNVIMGGDDLIIRGLKIVADEFNSLLQRRSKITFEDYESLKSKRNWKESIQ